MLHFPPFFDYFSHTPTSSVLPLRPYCTSFYLPVLTLTHAHQSHHRKECEELEADERNIEMKIIKKQEELERSEKRYKSLENVRPQFMDEVRMLWLWMLHSTTPSMTMTMI